MDVHARVGLNVRNARLREGISQEELAHASGLDRTYVSGIERGLRNPTVTVLVQLAEVLRITPASLLDGIGEPSRRSSKRG
jgi:transcriptional regulator with XRE-family HTH domain